MTDNQTQADQSERERAELFRFIVESAEDYAIFTTDIERRVTSWNVGAERLMGWSEAEYMGRSSDLIFTPEDRELDQPGKEARKALAEGRAENKRWHLKKDGSRFWGDGMMCPLKGRRDRPRLRQDLSRPDGRASSGGGPQGGRPAQG